jgi:5-methylthioadenosine/S-adenosylhomocysteine deaminase
MGSLEAGKQADIAVVSLANVAQQPVSDVSSTLVFSSAARDVVMTMVAGEVIYRDGRSTTVDENELLHKTRAIGEKMNGG